MDQLQIVVIVLNILLTSPFAIGETWTLYKRNESLDGKICKDSEIAFRKELVHSRSECLSTCVIHADCKSVFHAENSGNCTGCTVIYEVTNQPSVLTDGSIYYRQTGKLNLIFFLPINEKGKK